MAQLTRWRSATLTRRLRRLSAGAWLRVSILVCAALAVALALLIHASTPTPARAQALIGQRAPAFSLTATQGGQTLAHPVGFSGSSDHPTLLVFFNTLCVHCVAGVQTAQTITEAPQGQESAAALYLDSPAENAQITGQYMARLRLNPPVLMDSGARVASRYGVAYYPTFILINPQGVVTAVWTSAPSASALRAAIAASQARP